jgi:hypothetical protein
MTEATSKFCPECGAGHEPAAQFCEQCGHHFTQSGAPPEEQPTAQQAAPTAQMPAQQPTAGDMPYVAPPPGTSTAKPTWPWVVGAIAAVLVIAGIVVALVLVLGGDDDEGPPASSYAGQLAATLDPLGAANTSMSDALGNLEPGDAIDDVASTRRNAATETSAARSAVEALALGGTTTTSAADQTLTTDAQQALRAERTLLSAMAAAISKPSERTANALAAPSQAARDAWARVDATIPGAGGELDNIDKLAAWARAKAGVTGNKAANANGANCGGFEGVSGVFARNVDCQTALRVAVNAQSGGGTEGFTCRVTGADDAAGTERWACSKGNATITFSATTGAAGDVPEGVPDDVVPDDQTDVPEGVPDDVVPDDQTDVPEGTPDDVVPDDTGGVG